MVHVDLGAWAGPETSSHGMAAAGRELKLLFHFHRSLLFVADAAWGQNK